MLEYYCILYKTLPLIHCTKLVNSNYYSIKSLGKINGKTILLLLRLGMYNKYTI